MGASEANSKGVLFEVQLRDGILTFNSFEEIENWIEGERKAFAWLSKGSDIGNAFQVLREEFRNSSRELLQRLREWRDDPTEPNRKRVLEAAFSRLYGSDRLKMSTEAPAAIAIELDKTLGPDAAAGAYASLVGVPCTINFETVRGIIAATAIRDGLSPGSAQLVADAISRANAAGHDELLRRHQQWTELQKGAETQIEDQKRATQALLEKTEGEASILRERFNQDGADAIKQIQTTEAAYKEQMRLQAPVEYWDAKAKVHREDVARSRLRLVQFAVGGTIALLVALLAIIVFADWFSSNKAGSDAAVLYLKFAALGAIVTTVAFWTARILLRIYLSDRHLLTDAEERVAMIKTYLALTNEGKVEATERALVLAPVFRSAADGIVKDEGPDASLAGIIARAIDVKGKA